MDSLAANARGFIPGPMETREEFYKRIASCPAIVSEVQACTLTQNLFDACPDWIDVHTGSKGLHLWEGAATWIEDHPDGTKSIRIQVKPNLSRFFYKSEEVIAHELAHAMRAEFEESRFEEVLAYRTSKNSLRRFFGPLFRKPSEAKAMMGLLLITWISSASEMILERDWGGQFFFLAFIGALGIGIARLVHTQRTFSAALRNLRVSITDPKKALAVAFRLTDEEIALFSKSTSPEIQAYAEQEKEKSLRWEQIAQAYF